MADNNYTIWQRLTKVFGPDSTLDQQAPVYNFDKKQILKTTDKKEFEKEKLQSQQTLYRYCGSRTVDRFIVIIWI